MMIFRNADAIFASSISTSGKSPHPSIDCDVKKDRLSILPSTTSRVEGETCFHTHFGLEVDSPTQEVILVWESSEMQVRDGILRCFHHKNLRISSSSMIRRIPGLIFPGKSGSRYC